jgi:hypothetical protein
LDLVSYRGEDSNIARIKRINIIHDWSIKETILTVYTAKESGAESGQRYNSCRLKMPRALEEAKLDCLSWMKPKRAKDKQHKTNNVWMMLEMNGEFSTFSLSPGNIRQSNISKGSNLKGTEGGERVIFL